MKIENPLFGKADFHAILGTFGAAFSIAIGRVSETMSCLAATATAVYMTFRALKEFSKYRSAKLHEKILIQTAQKK